MFNINKSFQDYCPIGPLQLKHKAKYKTINCFTIPFPDHIINLTSPWNIDVFRPSP